jgi:integrase/recombinase XerD
MVGAMNIEINPDVEVYTRHVRHCSVTDPQHRKCACPKWLYVKHGRRRLSARTTSWTVAETKAQHLRDQQDPTKRELAQLKQVKQRNTVLLAGAMEKWLGSKPESAEGTVLSYAHTIRGMRDWLAAQGVFYLHEVTEAHLADLMATHWSALGPGTKMTRRAHIRIFFRYCWYTMKWLPRDQDPSCAIPVYKNRHGMPTVPFERSQYEAILAATYEYGKRRACPDDGVRLRALVQLMRWSGLAIRDAVTLHRSALQSGDVLLLRRAKTGVPVTVPIPSAVATELRQLPPGKVAHPDYFFWSKTCKAAHATSNWAVNLRQLWRLVDWNPPLTCGGKPITPHSHMFRNTFAKEFLQSRQGDIRDLAALLGHTNITTTEKSYLAFVPAYAEELNNKVRASWASQGAPV